MHIAIIAWSSVVRDPGELAVSLEFKVVGPQLSLAFSRIAPDGALTLVIDEAGGMPSRTWVAPSAKAALTEAIDNLAAYEGVTAADIGFVSRKTGKRNDVALQRHPRALAAIQAWAPAAGHDHVIWNAAASNFREQTRRVFSVNAAMDYLAGLDEATRKRALMHIRTTPKEVRSLLRAEIDRRWPMGRG